jgi:hypothetical protein
MTWNQLLQLIADEVPNKNDEVKVYDPSYDGFVSVLGIGPCADESGAVDIAIIVEE